MIFEKFKNENWSPKHKFNEYLDEVHKYMMLKYINEKRFQSSNKV